MFLNFDCVHYISKQIEITENSVNSTEENLEYLIFNQRWFSFIALQMILYIYNFGKYKG